MSHRSVCGGRYRSSANIGRTSSSNVSRSQLATTAGVITGITVQLNQSVQRGVKLMTLEAMKMQSNIYAPIAGRVSKLLVAPGQNVEAKDLLVTIVP